MKAATDLEHGGHDPAPLDITVTRMRRRHLRAVLRIEEASIHNSWSLGLFMNELALRTSRQYAVALYRHEVIGFGGLLFTGADAHVTTMSTHPRFYRHQVATRVLLALSRAAISRGSEHMTLEVRASNDAALALYRRFGFEAAGVRKNYYSDLNEDAIIMWAHHIDQPDHAERLALIDGRVAGRTRVERLSW